MEEHERGEIELIVFFIGGHAPSDMNTDNNQVSVRARGGRRRRGVD